MIVVAFAVAAALGALARWGLRSLGDGVVPLGTLTVNLLGSAAIGLQTSVDLSGGARTVVVVAGLGAFTTFSTFVGEVVELSRSGARRVALAYGVGSALGCVAAAWAGAQF